jgi:hypothetical protein
MGGWPSNDPIGQHLARASGGLDADGVEAGSDKQVAHLGRLAQQVAVVWREAFGPVEEQVDAGFLPGPASGAWPRLSSGSMCSRSSGN